MSKVLSQKDYLKKYLSSDDKLKKKKKKSKDKHQVKNPTVRIIDDDEHGTHSHNADIDESELYALNEEAPQIVGVIDERAPDVFMKQEYVESGKWKKIGETAVKIDKLSKHRKRAQSDESPPRKAESSRRLSPDVSPRRAKNSSDESPPRMASKPSRRDSDNSPPRRSNNRRESTDNSPPRRSQKPEASRRRDSSDNSPPRRQPRSAEKSRNRRDSSDISPPRRQPRSAEKSRNRRDSSDISPPRKQRRSPDIKTERQDSARRSRKSSRSPRRERRSRWSPEVKREPVSPARHERNRDSSLPKSSRMTKTLDGKASGLQDAKTLKRENDAFKERQDKQFNQMKPEMSGRDADIVVRDRRGRNKEFEFEVENERQKAAAEEARKKVYDRWGKGLKQIEDLEQRFQEHMHEASKPLARMADDADLQDHLKHQERLDDPMLEYMRKKKDDANKKKGVEVKPKYLGQFPDNRYNIRPGYRWDGVDRSNGYEKKYFSMVNSKISMQEEAYRYSTEDM